MEYQHIFLDLDGTLTDSMEGLYNAARYMLDKIGLEENNQGKIYRFFGPPITHTLARWYGIRGDRAQMAQDAFREYYLDKGVYQNRLFDGALEMIRDLKQSGVGLYIATGKTNKEAEGVVDHLRILKLFDGIFCANHEKGRSTKAEILAYAVGKINCEPNTAVMVGDTPGDIEGGKANKFETIGVLYGYGRTDEIMLARPDYTVKNIGELRQLLLR